MPYNKEHHDCGILRSDGSTKVGLMLARGNDGEYLYQVDDDEPFASQQVSEAGYGALPYGKELVAEQHDWRSGFGLEVYDENDPKRYNSSYGMDMRHRGMAIQSYKPSAATLPTTPTVNDAGFEAWDDGTTPTNWTQVEPGTTNGVTQDSANERSGTYSAALNTEGTSESTGIYQDLANWSNAFRSTTWTVGFYVKATDANMWKVRINDGVGETNGTAHTGGGSYELLTCTRQLDSSATRIRVGVYANTPGANKVAYVDDCQIPASGVIKVRQDFSDEMYFSRGSILLAMSSAGAITIRGAFLHSITSLKQMQVGGADYLFIAFGTSQNYWYMTEAEAFTESTATDKQYEHFELLDATAPTMYGNDGTNTLRSTVNPLNGGTAWSTQTTVDATYNAITGLRSVNSVFYILKEDRPFYLDTTGNVKVLTNITEHMTSTTGGKNSFHWLGYFYMPYGTQALLEYNVANATYNWKDPSDWITNLADFDGQVFAVTGDERWLFAVVDNGTKVEVLAGRFESIDGTTQWVWHPTQEITLDGCETAWVSNVYQRRLWIASTDSTDSLYYIPLPDAYGDIANDTNRDFDTSTRPYVITPWLHFGYRDDTKAFIQLFLKLGHSYDADIYFNVDYELWKTGTWVDVGNFKGTSTDRQPSAFIDISNKPAREMVRFKINAFTDDATKTPILLDYNCHAVLYTTRRRIIKCTVVAGDNVRDKLGQQLDESATIKTVLEEASADLTYPTEFYDPDGATINVRLLPTSPLWEYTKNETAPTKPERRFNLVMQEVELS
ncbi:hypothetical protein CMI37_31770 [Candidatus Pacearchaeota archaeon]|nr:hypothetical protein [Candidatus Pacearchaeota archaeon]|tara:strand:+ start:781 stop:3132 length:2352 start_codon:yes stop_codon:yes gene_type:complete